MRNVSNRYATETFDNLKVLFNYVYKKAPSPKKRVNINKFGIKFPSTKTIYIDINDFKNIRKIFSFLFANIDKKPFIDKNYNRYAFELLWIILEVLEQDPYRTEKFRKKDLFADERLYPNIADLIQFGKYVFTIPKYKRFTFDVQGFGLAKLTVQ